MIFLIGFMMAGNCCSVNNRGQAAPQDQVGLAHAAFSLIQTQTKNENQWFHGHTQWRPHGLSGA
jgi:hypothetical protein